MNSLSQSRHSLIGRRTSLFAVLEACAIAVIACVLLPAMTQFQGSRASAAQSAPSLSTPASPKAPQADGVRIGTYDSRAIAVAYTRSNQFAQKMKEMQRQ